MKFNLFEILTLTALMIVKVSKRDVRDAKSGNHGMLVPLFSQTVLVLGLKTRSTCATANLQTQNTIVVF